MIELRSVCFQYAEGGAGVGPIDLVVRKGECVVLTGPSGCGKTTVTRLLNGLAPGYVGGRMRGEIVLDGQSLTDLPAYEIGRLVGSVFQDPKSQFFSAELAGEVAFGCENYGLSHEEICRRTDEAIAQFSLEGLRGRSLDVLSSGEKQRVAMASVAALGPQVYVCDEPTANLDAAGIAQLAETLRRLKAEGATLIIAEHRLSWLMGLADRFLYMQEGRILWARSPAEMAAMPEAARLRAGLREIVARPLPQLAAPDETAAAIVAQELCCVRGGTRIFAERSFAASRGQITAITGPNGIGKTSLALVLAGLWRERSGEVRIGGRPCPAAKRRRAVWYSANDTGTQFFTNSVSEELLLGGDRSERRLAEARALLQELGLYEHMDAHPATLSGGEKLRLSIACGLFSGRPSSCWTSRPAAWMAAICCAWPVACGQKPRGQDHPRHHPRRGIHPPVLRRHDHPRR